MKKLKIGDEIFINTAPSVKDKKRKLAKVLKLFPKYVLLDLGRYKVCATYNDIANENYITI